MVNFHDPAIILQDSLAVTKFWHVLAGLYIWEFVTTLDYEWSVIRGRRPYRWTIVIYSISRVACLMEVILTLISVDVTTQYNCQVAVTFIFIFGYLAVAAASFLIVLRITAIWNKDKLAVAIATGVWVINLGFLIRNIVQVRSARVPANPGCTLNILSTRLALITTLITDIILLLIMLVGLLRLGFHESGVFGLGHFMWRQGLIWLFLATIAYIPPLVVIHLNLNESLDSIFQSHLGTTVSIAATRIYRSLVDFSSRSADIATISDKRHPINFTTSKFNRDPAQPNSPELVEVSERNKTSGQYLASQTHRHAPFISGDRSQNDKPVGAAGLGLDYDLERVAESQTLAPH